MIEGIKARIMDTYADGMLLVQVDKADRHAVKAFLNLYFAKTKANMAKRQGTEQVTGDKPIIAMSYAFWHKRRTLKQNALYWALVGILAHATFKEFGHEEVVHEEILMLYAPRIVTPLRKLEAPMRSKDMDTVTFAILVEGVFFELATLGVTVDSGDQIAGYWRDWMNWRGQQKQDPLRGTYKNVQDYRQRVCFCEACLKYLGGEERGSIAHIVVRQWGIDDDWNLFRLCDPCHTGLGASDGDMGGFDKSEAQHKVGWDKFLAKYPHLKWKYDRAQTKGRTDDAGLSDPGAGVPMTLGDAE